jgi:vacuole morphology and inheritance protein 14
MEYVVSLSDEPEASSSQQPSRIHTSLSLDRPDGGASSTRVSLSSSREFDMRSPTPAQNPRTPTPGPSASPQADLDYAAAVNSLTLLFLNDHEATRVAALTWLIMLHRKAPRKIVAFNDGTFPALLKTLSDPAEAVVTKDLQLLSQISRNSEDDYFSNFMVSLLQLFSTDRKLLETRGNLIIRQLCMTLSAERIYRTLAECIEKEEDLEFASIMVQNLNNNLITAPELTDLRKRLRNLETKVPSIATSPPVASADCMCRTARPSLLHSSARGVTMPWLHSRFACLHKHTRPRTIFYRSCRDTLLGDSPDTNRVQCGARNDGQYTDPN